VSKLKISILNEDIRPKSGFTKVLYFTDAHNQPTLPMERFLWIAGLANDERPDFIVDGGDFDDFHSLCGHEGNETYKGKLKPSLQRDLDASNEARELMALNLLHDCPKFITLGNHEHRLWNYQDKNPEMYGIPVNMYLDILERHKWGYVRYGEYLDIAGVNFTHVPFNANGKPVQSETGCKQIAEKSIRDICYGHTHKKDEWSAAKFGASLSVVAFNGGCFMPDGYVPSYAKDTRKEFWYGCHIIMIKDKRIKSIKSFHISELQEKYGRLP